MAKDISANVELEGGSIEVTPSLSDLTLAADADIRGLIPVERGKAAQSDWNETDPESDAYILNKPIIPSLDGYATEDWVEDKGYLTEQAQSDWTEEDNTSASYVQNKPSIASGTGYRSIAEGYGTTSSGLAAHSEGIACTASDSGSHAEGRQTEANGKNSHAEGYKTIASGNNSHVQGKYNIEDANDIYAHIVGNGTAEDDRSNAHTLDWDGNAWFAGKVTADGTPTNDNDLVSKKWVEDKGYLTQHQDISSKADKSEIPTKVSDLSNDSEFINGLTELVYGTSTWAEFTAARNAKKIVYCRCPMSGNSYRYAFLAYVSNTNAEFQYYRSVNAHTASQMGDQVFVYTLSNNGTWTTTTREASSKVIAGTGLESSYTKDKLTLSIKSDYPTKAEVSAMIAEALAAYANGNT